MEAKKGLQKITKLALVVSNPEHAELVPLGPDQIAAIHTAVDPQREGLPEEIIFCKSIRESAFRLMVAAQALALAFHEFRVSDDLESLFDPCELTALHNMANVAEDRAEKVQLLVNAFWKYLAKERAARERRAGEDIEKAE